jgi:amidohydrolase
MKNAMKDVLKEKILSAVDGMSAELKRAAGAIFAYNEAAFEEVRSSRELADFLAKEGFEIEWGQAGLPTAFTARYGTGRPHIALTGEYDALPEMGHACGHNMIGTISAGAAAAVKQCLPPGGGSVFFVGCPAEEHGGGKVLLTRSGVFDTMDAAMQIHPADISTGFDISYAIKRYFVEFFGKGAHAAAAPYKGLNALDATIAFWNGISLMRQQMPERTRVHGVILDGGRSFNTIPDYAKSEMGIRALRMEEVLELEKKMIAAAEGAALMTGCSQKITEEDSQEEVYVNVPIARALDRNFEAVGEKTSTRTYGMGVGSTDAGIVTHTVPGIHGYVNITGGVKIPTHSSGFAAASNSEYGYEAMIRAVKALALTARDLFFDEALLREAKTYFEEKRREF